MLLLSVIFTFVRFYHAGLVSASHRIDCFSREILKQVQDDNGMLLLPVIFTFVRFCHAGLVSASHRIDCFLKRDPETSSG